MALVYDNTHTGGKTEQDTKLVTVVGYVPIEVDGYGGALGAGDLKSYTADPTYLSNKPTSYPGGTSTVLGTDGNTMYGHALDDIIQPSPPGGGCDFMQNLRAAAAKYGKATVRLVGPNEHIGMAANH